MTLDNSAKIGDIITALEGMQAINQKAELASVIGSPATATDNIATQITKIQDAKDDITTVINSKGGEVTNSDSLASYATAISGIVTGKKWASGSLASLPTNQTHSITMDFIPKIIICSFRTSNTTNNMLSISSEVLDISGNFVIWRYGSIGGGASVAVNNRPTSGTVELMASAANALDIFWIAIE